MPVNFDNLFALPGFLMSGVTLKRDGCRIPLNFGSRVTLLLYRMTCAGLTGNAGLKQAHQSKHQGTLRLPSTPRSFKAERKPWIQHLASPLRVRGFAGNFVTWTSSARQPSGR
jgi:hypothetical protein